MPDTSPDPAAVSLYGPEYYATHCGAMPYARNDHWLQVFGAVADVLVRSFAPHRVFDAGCALGLLVESLWDRGVEAHGRDVSEWAIGQVRPDIRPWCQTGSIADPIDGPYDLITCIEVVEHMPEPDALAALASMAAATDRVLFSSSPTDFTEPTHVTVRPTSFWLSRWAELGFAPSVMHDAGYLAPHAYVLERSEAGRSPRDLVAFADRIRHRVALAQIGVVLMGTREALDKARQDHSISQAEAVQACQDLQVQIKAAERLRAQLVPAEARATEQEARLNEAAAALTQIRSELRSTESERDHAQQAAAAAAAQAHAQAHANRHTQAALDAVLSSTLWRATWPLRRLAARAPRSVRRLGRAAPRLLWWTATLQLPSRLRDRRAIVLRTALINASPLFDGAWYGAVNPDVGPSNLLPARHYAVRGGFEQRDPSPQFSVAAYMAAVPASAAFSGGAFLHALAHGVITPNQALPSPAPASGPPPQPPPLANVARAEGQIAQRFPGLAPLPVFATPGIGRRLTVVTDSIGAGSLYGGVGTALILAALAARRLDAGLRLITRTEPGDAASIAALLDVQGIAWQGSIDVLHIPTHAGVGTHDVPVAPDDLFLTTSWWTTHSVRQSIPAARIAYVLQEDERMFYPLGDDYLRCTETLSDPSLLYLVNTSMLRTHLQSAGLAPGAVAFEPSFPEHVYHPRTVEEPSTRQFFFYARPNNTRNLYWRGLEAVCAAIEQDVLDPAEWEFHFAGHGAGPLTLPRGVKPHFPGPMAWSDYAAFVRRMDVGLSLMYTPHPSYPPLDLAASGAVVVTNRFPGKPDLAEYSPNILCVEPEIASLVAGIRQAVALSSDRDRVLAGVQGSRFQRDWAASMAPALDRLAEWAVPGGGG